MIEIVSQQMEKCFGTALVVKDRSVRLAYLRIRLSIQPPLLSDCQAYFADFSHLPCCFDDIRQIVTALSHDEAEAFARYTDEFTNGLLPDAQATQVHCFHKLFEHQFALTQSAQETVDKWRQIEINDLKFHYLIYVSCAAEPVREVLDWMVVKATQLLVTGCEDLDVGCLAVLSLLLLHQTYVCRDEEMNPLEISENSRLLLQATMLVRHLTILDPDKQQRRLWLFSARLHMNLGLGSIAFKQYEHVKCKEVLHDSLAPYLLSRIAQTHPFDLKTMGGSSAEHELDKALNSIDRMTKRTEDFIIKDVDSFHWDQAADLLVLRDKFRTSLTKYLCLVNRYRISRLKGESTDSLPILWVEGESLSQRWRKIRSRSSKH